MEDLELENSSEAVQEDTKEEKKWCVYCHTNKTNGKKYIGITSQKAKYRWGNGNGYKKQQYFYRAIQKYGWSGFTHEILFENKSFREACNLEQYLIHYYKTRDKNFGYNATDGGAGTQGHSVSEKTRKILSEKAKIRFSNKENHPMYGKHIPEEQKQKARETLREKYKNEPHPNKGRARSKETREKISKNRKGKNTGQDNYWYGKHLTNNVKEQLSRKGKERLKNPEDNPMYGKHHTERTKETISKILKERWTKNFTTPVYSVELNEIFIGPTNVFYKYGFDASAITKCCKGKIKSCGKHPKTKEKLHWKYVYDQTQKDGTIIPGAITLGYITEQQLYNYLNSLKKEIDIDGTMEEK